MAGMRAPHLRVRPHCMTTRRATVPTFRDFDERNGTVRVVVSEFMSLDGVLQAPGGKDEDTTGGFRHGGWSYEYFDPEVMGAVIDEYARRNEVLLQGRRRLSLPTHALTKAVPRRTARRTPAPRAPFTADSAPDTHVRRRCVHRVRHRLGPAHASRHALHDRRA